MVFLCSLSVGAGYGQKIAKENKNIAKNYCYFVQAMLPYQLHYAITLKGERGEDTMKEAIHPDYYATTIRCACGKIIETGSTKQDIRVEVCSTCHPFYTGKQKLVDTGGRVSRFNKKFGL